MSALTRRSFLAAGAAATLSLPRAAAARRRHRASVVPFPELPNYCGHEHWGSIDAIGPGPGGFRADVEPGAVPSRRVDVLDLVLDPYFNGSLRAAGFDLREAARAAGYPEVHAWWRAAPEALFNKLRPALEQQRLTGMFQCTARGILQLHGADLRTLELEEWHKADEGLGEAYANIFGWYEDAMAAMRFTHVVRPMQPEYYFADFTTGNARHEGRFTGNMLRVDALLDMWRVKQPRREKLSTDLGIDPVDAAGWRQFITALFDRAAARGALGTKQLQAYARDLDFVPRADSEVRWRGELSPEEVRTFQDWVMNECFAQAESRNWIHQVHVGTHNIDESTPLPLEGLARRFPQLRMVMIHCWPFIEEAGWLAKQVSNIYIDSCWQPILSPSFFRDSLETWLDYVPNHKLLCSHDATSIEMAAGSALYTREALHEALQNRRGALGGKQGVLQVAKALLADNALALYGS